MEITQTTTITININGQNYQFADAHPITDLILQLNNEQLNQDLWQQRLTESTNRITDLQAQIQVLCITPV